MWSSGQLAPEEQGPAAQIVKEDCGRISAGCAHDASAWMGTGSGKIEPFDGPTVVAHAERRPHCEHLIDRHFEVHDVAAQQSQLPLKP